MRKGGFLKPPVIHKMTGFLFAYFIRNKTFCNLICYVFLLISFLASLAYGLTVSSSSYDLGIISFMHGAGAISSSNNTAVWTAVGENTGSLTELSDTQYSMLSGQLFLFSVPADLLYWVISNLQAKADILGLIITEKTWQKDTDPYFYWDVDVTPPDKVEGFSTSLDIQPALEISTAEPNYQFSLNSISSGKHIFYVLPYTTAKGWDTHGLSFEIWVDAEAPVAGSLQPTSGLLTSNNLIPISCSLYDEHSGINKLATVLTVNNQNAIFEYDEAKQMLAYQPNSPLPDGDNSVLLKAVDAVGNTTTKGWNFIVDTQPPAGSILINGGQEVTHSAYVSINIEAKDATSGIKSIYLSNDGIFDTELMKPYSYSPVISNWLLRDPDISGKKSVYAKFEDTSGNLSPAYTAEIELELMTANTRIISGPATITEEAGATFMYEASKDGCLFSYKLDNLNWSDWQSANKTEFSGLAKGNHYFYVKAGYDLNGDGQITIDEEDPTPAQWVWTIKPEGYFEKLRERILFWRR